MNDYYRSDKRLVHHIRDQLKDELAPRTSVSAKCPDCGGERIAYTRLDGLPWSVCENKHLFTSFHVSRENLYDSDATTVDETWTDMKQLEVGGAMSISNRYGNFLVLREG